MKTPKQKDRMCTAEEVLCTEYGFKRGRASMLQSTKDLIDKCKIHTAGVLVLIEKKELMEKLNEI